MDGEATTEVVYLDNHLSERTTPVETIRTARHWPDIFIQEMAAIMTLHGGSLVEQEVEDECVFHFPGGTVKRALHPISNFKHYTIIFPDGFQIVQHQLLHGSETLVFPMSAFSAELQAKYPSL